MYRSQWLAGIIAEKSAIMLRSRRMALHMAKSHQAADYRSGEQYLMFR
ncbi:hypothetical protein [Paenibacillus agaridevorans]|nr:hypothetical protein [Paenibacillus agaridevorans]